MADLPNRQNREDELAAAIALALQTNRPKWEDGFIPWYLRRELTAVAVPPLAQAFTDSAAATQDELGIAVGGADRAGLAYGALLGSVVAGAVIRSAGASLQGLRSAVDTRGLTQAIIDSPRWGTVAATEVTRAATAGGKYVANTYVALRGLLVQAVWHTSADARVCPVCAPLDGLMQDAWSQQIPDGPPAHPNCRCWLDYSFIGRN